MTIAWLRDLVIVVLGIVAIGALVFWSCLAWSLYRRTKRIMLYLEAAAAEIKAIADGLMQPMGWLGIVIQGIQGFFRSKKGPVKNNQEEEQEHG